MSEIRFDIALHSRFRVGASFGWDGRDVSVDHSQPLHGDHLKGLMRAEAAVLDRCGHLTGSSRTLVDQVFGTPRNPCEWTWTAARPVGGASWTFADRRRVRIDRELLATDNDMLVRGETAWVPAATFSVVWCGSRMPDPVHESLLAVTGAAVHHIGAWRRRGLGWVGVTAVGRDLVADVQTIREAGR